ncbi:SGNH/GDSL hydrolase family protein [Ferruginibacter paludis]|uniref:SGNH/GDSL hydrolase family protein n=1 Tax=Ferruginibacter TaxID=1004303 RepID=UPI0025B5C283|nr:MULTISPECIES: SGNH/GDSL hydrolase family protein [Ferruginibacter]MDB5278079.1 family lipolytic protein [Ferruginibacter sp.]MDN3654808.1 SGNH/GDSL hydrolase family protein [Ferruginibacter paludis]
MKYLSRLLLLLPLTWLSFTNPPKKIKVVFFGDSITQAGVQPTGYITKLDSVIKQLHLPDSIELAGAGIGGNKVYDLYLRMDEDVLKKNPDVVVIYVGINDVWHKASSGTGTDPDKFERFYRAIIKKLQEKNIKVILCTPSVIGERNDNSNQQDGDLNQYSTIIRTMAKDLSLPVCDLHKAFADYLKVNNASNQEKGILTSDRVHLNEKGNLFVAMEMWKALQNIIK